MRLAPASISSIPTENFSDSVRPPQWVDSLLCNQQFFHVSTKIENAVAMQPTDLRRQTQNAYGKIFEQLTGYHPVRFWNFLPSIHDHIDNAQNRYMVFNSGRYQAFEIRYGDREQFDRSVATASAVGHQGEDLWIHCLASQSPGIHLGNPRQVSPHRYSSRYGRLPPCFARATLLPEQYLLMIGGTASICGEESVHDDLAEQTRETLANLQTVIQSDIVHAHCAISENSLDCMTDVRVYYPRKSDAPWLENHLKYHLPSVKQLTLVQADLCRPELLVEMEAIARLSPKECQ